MLQAKRRSERLVTLVLAGAFALNYPLLYLFSEARLLFGIPVLYLYLFVTWAIFIAMAALVMERSPPENHTSGEPRASSES